MSTSKKTTTKKTAKKKTKKKVAKKKARSTKDLERKPASVEYEDAPEEIRETLDVIESEGRTMQIDLVGANPQFQKYEIAKRVAHTLANSNLVPDEYRGRPNDCFVALNMGAELGMEPFQAIQSIAVIEGKPCLYGDGLIGVVRASPKCKWIEETMSDDGTVATCRTLRDGDPNPTERSYSMDDAVLAGISNKYNWKKHPKRMLQMRARSYCLRDAYPDLLKGLGVVEEMQDHDDTPPPVVTYDLPTKEPDHFEEQAKAVFGQGVERQPTALEQKVIAKYGEGAEITQALVEYAMHQSDNMEELLEAGNLAKLLTEQEQSVCRITYKKMRNALMEDAS